jgi:sugar/nucleoside kinase (ribokinase family)
VRIIARENLIIVGELHQDLIYETNFFQLLIEKVVNEIQNFIKYNPDDLKRIVLEKIIKKAISDIPKKINADCTLKRGGNGNNTAEYCVSLGIPTKLISVMGKNTDWMIHQLNELGVNTDLIFKNDLLTPISTILKSELTTKIFIAQNLKKRMNFEGIKLDIDIFKDAKFIYITPITEKFKNFIKIGFKHDLFSILNIEAQKISNFEQLEQLIYEKVDIIFVNRDDANLILNKKLSNIEIDNYFKKFARIRVYTAGKEGSFLFTDSIDLSYPTIKLKVIKDRTGAGDCYAAGFITKLYESVKDKSSFLKLIKSQNLDQLKSVLSQCMEFATYTALYKITTQKIPTRKDIEDFIKKIRSG